MPICMQDTSGIHLQQRDRQQGCHGVCQQVKLAEISQASKSFWGLRSDSEIAQLGSTRRLFHNSSIVSGLDSLTYSLDDSSDHLGGIYRGQNVVR